MRRIILWENIQLSSSIFLSGVLFLVSCLFFSFLSVMTNLVLCLSVSTLAAKLYVRDVNGIRDSICDTLIIIWSYHAF